VFKARLDGALSNLV